MPQRYQTISPRKKMALFRTQVAGKTWPRHQYSILVTGVARFKVVKVIKDDPYAVAQVEPIADDEFSNKDEFSELVDDFRKNSKKLLELLDLTMPSVRKLQVQNFILLYRGLHKILTLLFTRKLSSPCQATN